MNQKDEDVFADWLAREDTAYQHRERERQRIAKEAARIPFEHMRFQFKRRAYANALGIKSET